MNEHTTVGIDLAKHVFAVHAVARDIVEQDHRAIKRRCA